MEGWGLKEIAMKTKELHEGKIIKRQRAVNGFKLHRT